jgi:hypothetical protein
MNRLLKHDTTNMKHGNSSKNNIHYEVMHAEAKTTVRKYNATIYDDSKEGPILKQTHLEESFYGDIKGDGVVDTLQASNKQDKSSSFVGIERITGTIGNSEGTFLLQVAGTNEGKIVTCEWFVIPGSGTGKLTGLRGEGGFRANFGEGGDVHLDYWFE